MPSSFDPSSAPQDLAPATRQAPAGSPLYTIVTEAAQLANAPIALVTFLTEDAQWIVAGLGFDEQRTSREAAFCAWALHSAEVLFVQDAAADPRFKDNPFVVGEPFVRFYAGAPIATPEGTLVGTVCVLDSRPRPADRLLADRLALLAGRAAEHLPRAWGVSS